MEYCGHCRKCEKYYKVLSPFDERKNAAFCPDCNSRLYMDYKSLETIKKEIKLTPDEIGKFSAIVR